MINIITLLILKLEQTVENTGEKSVEKCKLVSVYQLPQNCKESLEFALALFILARYSN